MINKGELYMGYENIDEVTRKEACEKVKQIVEAIKAIKIKYYLNFSKMPTVISPYEKKRFFFNKKIAFYGYMVYFILHVCNTDVLYCYLFEN